MTDPEEGDLFDLFDDVEAEDEPEVDEAVHGAGSVAAQLADGSGYLVVDGPDAGTVTASSGNADIEQAPKIATRDEALNGTLPLMLLHRPKNYHAAMPRLMALIHARFGDRLVLGTAAQASKASEVAHQTLHTTAAAAAINIVDPEGYYTQPGDLVLQPPSARRIKRLPYLAAGRTPTAADYLDAQRARTANLLLSSGRGLDSADPQASLDAACAAGDDALALLGAGERLALNLTMSSHWLTNPTLLTRLLDQLLDQQQFDTWYLRVQIPANVRSQAQPVDDGLLRGYQRIAELALDEERNLLLPQTGLTGWFLLAFGAAGFGTSQSGAYQQFRQEIGTGGGGNPELERYFERQILHSIERTSRTPLTTDPAYEQCTCSYCRALFAPGSAWSYQYAELHQVYNAARLTASLSPTPPAPGGIHAQVRRTVRAASAFATGKGLSGVSDPRHLPLWDRVV